MSGIDILIDSNIAIYFLLGYSNVQKYFLDLHPGLSFISGLEILSGAKFEGSDYEYARTLLSQHEIIAYMPELRNIVINVRSQKKLRLPDAIIAATAIYLNVPLVSADKAFKNTEGLDLILHDPASL